MEITGNLSPSTKTNPLPFVSCIQKPLSGNRPSASNKSQNTNSDISAAQIQILFNISAAHLSILLEEKTHLETSFKAIFPNIEESLLQLNSQKQIAKISAHKKKSVSFQRHTSASQVIVTRSQP